MADAATQKRQKLAEFFFRKMAYLVKWKEIPLENLVDVQRVRKYSAVFQISKFSRFGADKVLKKKSLFIRIDPGALLV